jgi:hypothetical protein
MKIEGITSSEANVQMTQETMGTYMGLLELLQAR